MIIKNISNDIVMQRGAVNFNLKSNETMEIDDSFKHILEKNKDIIDWTNPIYKTDRPHLGYLSAFNSRFGYGVGGMAWVKALVKNGIGVKTYLDYNTDIDFNSLPDSDSNLIKSLSSVEFIPAHNILHTIPISQSKMPVAQSDSIIHTMWEGDKLPPKWAEIINRHKALIIPSENIREMFITSGVNIPIAALPYPIDLSQFPYKTRTEDTEDFTFFSWGVMNHRKCPYETIQTFIEAFPKEDYPNVKLLLKSHLIFGDRITGVPTINDDRIKIVFEHWSQAQLLEHLYKSNACIFLTRGEGFQIPLYEASASGIPVIACNNTAPKDFCNLGNPWNVQTKDMVIGYDEVGWGSDIKWCEPDYFQAVDHMRNIYHNYTESLKKAKIMSRKVRKYLNDKEITSNLISFLDTL